MKHKNLFSQAACFCQLVKFLFAFEAGIICHSSYYVDVMLACLKENNKDIARFYTVFLLRRILYSPVNFKANEAATN